MKLRTKFLIAVSVLLFVFGCGTLFVVTRTCRTQIRQVLVGDLRSSVLTFRTYERGREATLTNASVLLANLPNLRALMTTKDTATIQDATNSIWKLVGSDLFVLSDRDGRIMAVHTSAADLDPQYVAQSLNAKLHSPRSCNFSLVRGRLFEVFTQPIYFGEPSETHLLGLLTVGYEIDKSLATEFSEIAASQVAFEYGTSIVATTLEDPQRKALTSYLQSSEHEQSTPVDIDVAGEDFLLTSVSLTGSPVPVQLVVLKSYDQASAFLESVNHILIAMWFAAIALACVVVFLITRKFTRPLDELLAGVRALEHGNFSYPLSERSKDEFAELTNSFAHMRMSLRTTQDQLLEAERLATIGRMASSISHDLRHRLSAVMANAEFLAEDGLTSRNRQDLYARVSRAVDRMTEMLESLLEFSRKPDSMRVNSVSIQEIAENAIESLRLHVEFQAVQIQVKTKKEVDGWFDARRLERAFYNLLLNACQMFPDHRGQVVITIDQVGECAEVLVSDNGPGIPTAIRDSLFRPFVSCGKQNGSGLGLAIVQKACQDHGGEVYLELSEPGRTTFKIRLPVDPRKGVVASSSNNPKSLAQIAPGVC